MDAAVLLSYGAPLVSVLGAAESGDWLALDTGVRDAPLHRSVYFPERRCLAPLPDDLAQADEPRLAVALCHRDGRIRAAALPFAERYPGLLPLVVIRCADWAEPVRQRARQLLRDVLDADTAAGLAALVLRMGRRDRGVFAVELLTEVLGAAPRDRLDVLLASPDLAVRRFTYRLGVEHGRLGPGELAVAAGRDPDTVVQDVCSTAALAALRDAGPSDEVIAPLLAARGPRARSAGVTALRRAGQTERAEPFLADRSGLVRACARYVVRHHGGDPAAWYRERCVVPGGPVSAPGAVIGLAECGHRHDAGLLRSLLAHPDGRVRAHAVAGLRVLDAADADLLLPLIDDPVSRVVRETVHALLPHAKALPVGHLTGRTGRQWPRHVRTAAFRLLTARRGVVALRAAVAGLDDPDVKLRTWAEQGVRCWSPADDEPLVDTEVDELLERSRHLFSG
ncbi:hypothetical protein I3F58_06340 [Streptomyces sp. MUM 203J]|uniref:hypothetical protein n=1 Tax=Streptomyces sp. MUM 203J TaxID=2791990 RepID=UPI001F03ADF6|nr:hypothetical protein [Streptomyces sp. MUM 203J]MCH0539180.1 hypothetical protein [Streptomyces sp. MUM 203J]